MSEMILKDMADKSIAWRDARIAELNEQLATRTSERDAAIKQIAQNGIEWGHREAELIAIAQVNTLCDLVDAVKELTEAVKNDKRVYNCDVHLNQ